MLGSNYVPPLTMGTREYWISASSGKFAIPYCSACSRFHYYPRLICPYCGSEGITLGEVTGRATVYSHTTVHLRLHPLPEDWPVPFVVALVELEEGPVMMTNIVNCEPSRVEIGMELKVTFGPSTFPVFQPAHPTSVGVK